MIATPNLIIEPFTDSDITEKYLGWLNDKNLLMFSEQRHKQHTFESASLYLRSFINSSNHFLSIKTKQSPTHIGNLTIYTDVNNKICDIGILIGDQNFSGQGLGFEAWRSAIDYLFANNMCRKITAGTMELNKPMIMIFEKSGMLREGTRPRQFLFGSKEIDLLQYAIFKDLTKSEGEYVK